mmetsp:Transcript_52191/g.167500  ORF Transcript_52191/g.167500 Transcript_52191/m.167500 type:complete len:315 (+) Transcript_52191:249-1193(+)
MRSCAADWAHGARRMSAKAAETSISSRTEADARRRSHWPAGRGTVEQEGVGSSSPLLPVPSEPMHLAVSCPPGQMSSGPRGWPSWLAVWARQPPDFSTRALSAAQSCTRWLRERRVGGEARCPNAVREASTATHVPRWQVVTSPREWFTAHRTSVHAAAHLASFGWSRRAVACASLKKERPARRSDLPLPSSSAPATTSRATCFEHQTRIACASRRSVSFAAALEAVLLAGTATNARVTPSPPMITCSTFAQARLPYASVIWARPPLTERGAGTGKACSMAVESRVACLACRSAAAAFLATELLSARASISSSI